MRNLIVALSVVIACNSAAFAEVERFTLPELDKQTRTYIQRGWPDQVQKCFFGELDDVVDDAEGDHYNEWKIEADSTLGRLTAENPVNNYTFGCDDKGLHIIDWEGKKTFIPHAKMWYNNQ